MKQSKDILLEKGLSPSFQRLKIYSYLRGTQSHPTAYSIFKELKEEIPSLSKTTVYNVLNVLVEKGLVNQVRIEDNELRFDAELREHGHFKCSTCGSVSDVFLDQDLIQLIEKKRIVEQIEFNIIGICESCEQKSNNNKYKLN